MMRSAGSIKSQMPRSIASFLTIQRRYMFHRFCAPLNRPSGKKNKQPVRIGQVPLPDTPYRLLRVPVIEANGTWPRAYRVLSDPLKHSKSMTMSSVLVKAIIEVIKAFPLPVFDKRTGPSFIKPKSLSRKPMKTVRSSRRQTARR